MKLRKKEPKMERSWSAPSVPTTPKRACIYRKLG